MCMGYFIAHFLTLYLQTMVEGEDAGAGDLGNKGRATGVVTSKSVDGTSISYDISSVMSDLDGWADWKSTAYGLQLATWAKMFSLGGMYVR